MNRAPTTTMVLNSTIVEYDIKQANVSLLEYYELLPPKSIEQIRSMPPDKRKVTVGLLMQRDKELATKLENGFDEIMTMFIKSNNLDIDLDVLTIKKDACFIISKTPAKTTFGPITFRPKGVYHSFLMIGNFEFYINDEGVDVKGLQKQASLHRNGILHLIKDVVDTAISANGDKSVMNKYLSELVLAYKKRELEFDYYREFNSSSQFHVSFDGESYLYDNISEIDIPDLDISFNYVNIILPLVRLFV